MQQFSSIIHALDFHARNCPDKIAYGFIYGDNKEITTVTFTELYQKVSKLAAQLGGQLPRGERAILMYPQGPDYVIAFLACLMAGVIAVPLYPPKANQKMFRTASVLLDCQASAILTNQIVVFAIDQLREQGMIDPRLKRIVTTGLTEEVMPIELPDIATSDIAFLQYTSGSTGDPKGVIVSHGNLVANQDAIGRAFKSSQEDICLNWLPVFHDMGLIGTVLHPLYCGYTAYLMASADFTRDPLSWLEAITKYRATVAGAPNFAFELLLQRIDAERLRHIDLRSLKIMFSGAEPIRADTLDNFAREFALTGFEKHLFYPCYGMAEATLFISGCHDLCGLTVSAFSKEKLAQGKAQQPDVGELAVDIVGCGLVDPCHEVRVVDPESFQEVTEGLVGEIWFTGASKALGYWGNEIRSRTDMCAVLSGCSSGKEYLRTGDLGFVKGQELYITGRLKDVIIIRGRNYYPQDIEFSVAEAHPALANGTTAAFSVFADTTEKLVVVSELKRTHIRSVDPVEVFNKVRAAISQQYQLDVDDIVLLRPGSIAKTTSGKIQRNQNRLNYIADELNVIASLAGSQQSESGGAQDDDVLLSLLRDYVQLPRQVDEQLPLVQYGIDSIRAASLSYQLAQQYAVQLDFVQLLDGMSIAHLRKLLKVDSVQTPKPREGELAGILEDYSLNPFQQLLWQTYLADPDSSVNNLSIAFSLPTTTNIEYLRVAVSSAIRDYPRLCCVFEQRDLSVFARPAPSQPQCMLRQKDTQLRQDSWLAQMHTQAFDLYNQAAVRAGVLVTDEAVIVCLCAHHIVMDYDSLQVLFKRIEDHYLALESRGHVLPALPLTIPFSEWHQGVMTQDYQKRAAAFWLSYLDQSDPRVSLAGQVKRPEIREFSGEACQFALSLAQLQQVKQLAYQTGTTPFAVMFAVYAVTIAQMTGKRNITLGVPVSAALGSDYEHVVGCHINALPVLFRFGTEDIFVDILKRLAQDLKAILRVRHYPSQRIAEALNLSTDLSFAPLFQMMFSYYVARNEVSLGPAFLADDQPLPFASAKLGRAGRSIRLPKTACLFDFVLYCSESDDGYVVQAEYNTGVLGVPQVTEFWQCFTQMLKLCLKNHPEPLFSLEGGDEPEPRQKTELDRDAQQYLVSELNQTAAARDKTELLHQLFEKQAILTPEAEAVWWQGIRLTYVELDNESNRLANLLQKKGVRPGTLVGISLARDPYLLIAVLAVLKAGAAYVPLDPNYPQDRLQYMVVDSKTRFILTQRDFASRFEKCDAECFYLEDVKAALADMPVSKPDLIAPSHQSLAYVIYTSGSTGQPKGVMISHGSIVNLIRWSLSYFSQEELRRVLFSTSLNFDISLFEMHAPLAAGGCCVIVESILSLLDSDSADLNISLINTVPSGVKEAFLQGKIPDTVVCIVLVGETLKQQIVNDLLSLTSIKRLINAYGPTEATVYATAMSLTELQERDPWIGRPLDNYQVFILDEHMQLVPYGETGELYLGGDGLANGYINDPVKTDDRFLKHPFGECSLERLYRTGDLARYTEQGQIEYIGRTDQQVKIKGHRIELKEVEFHLNSLNDVAYSIVKVVSSPTGHDKLVAFVELRLQHSGATEADVLLSLNSQLKLRLPDYMLPSYFEPVTQWPLTLNGKVDRRALQPRSQELRIQYQYASSLQQRIGSLIAGILGMDSIPSDVDFIELGLDSLGATRLLGELRSKLSVSLNLKQLFGVRDLASLTTLVEGLMPQTNTLVIEQDQDIMEIRL